MEIKLSKDAEKAIKILQDIDKKLKEFKTVYDKIDIKECNLVGGFVVGMYSPAGNIGTLGSVGNHIICDGLTKKLTNSNSMAAVFSMPGMGQGSKNKE